MIWKEKRVLIVGLGGLAAPWLEYFSRWHPILLGLMDGDTVEASNLTRQFIHEGRVGQLKTESALHYLEHSGHEGMVELHSSFITPYNAENIISDYDVIFDGTDNFQAKYLINLICHKLKKDLVYASGTDRYGQASFFSFKEDSACLSCLYPYKEAQESLSVCSPVTEAWPLREIAMKALHLAEAHQSHTIWHFEALTKGWDAFKKSVNPECFCQIAFNPSELFEDYRWDKQEDCERIVWSQHLKAEEFTQQTHAIVLTCESGISARNFCFQLRQKGLTNIYWSTH